MKAVSSMACRGFLTDLDNRSEQLGSEYMGLVHFKGMGIDLCFSDTISLGSGHPHGEILL